MGQLIYYYITRLITLLIDLNCMMHLLMISVASFVQTSSKQMQYSRHKKPQEGKQINRLHTRITRAFAAQNLNTIPKCNEDGTDNVKQFNTKVRQQKCKLLHSQQQRMYANGQYSIVRVLQHLELLKKACVRVSRVLTSVPLNGLHAPARLANVLTDYAAEIRDITYPVESEETLASEKSCVEMKRKSRESRMISEMINKLESHKTRFEVMFVIFWAKSDGNATDYLLHSVALRSYAEKLFTLAESIKVMKPSMKELVRGLFAVTRSRMASAMKEAIVDALEALDDDDFVRKKYQTSQETDVYFRQMRRLIFNLLPQQPPTLNQVIKLVQQELYT